MTTWFDIRFSERGEAEIYLNHLKDYLRKNNYTVTLKMFYEMLGCIIDRGNEAYNYLDCVIFDFDKKDIDSFHVIRNEDGTYGISIKNGS